jgi:hypothetical protein
MTRTQLLTRLNKAWSDFSDSYAGLSDAQMSESGVTGKWSVRDILAHVTTWEEEALKHLPTILKGDKPPRYSVTYGGIDAFNRIMTERKKTLTLAEVRSDLQNSHTRLIELVGSVVEDQLLTETPFRHRLRLDTYSHYPKHAEAIRKWRRKNEEARP